MCFSRAPQVRHKRTIYEIDETLKSIRKHNTRRSRRSDEETQALKNQRWSCLEVLAQAKDVWQIPLMKQFHASLSLLLFFLVFIVAVGRYLQ